MTKTQIQYTKCVLHVLLNSTAKDANISTFADTLTITVDPLKQGDLVYKLDALKYDFVCKENGDTIKFMITMKD